MAAAEVGLKGGGGGGRTEEEEGAAATGQVRFFLFICSIIGGLGEGKMGCWQAGPDSCLRPGRFRAAPYRAVPRAGPPCWGRGPGTKRLSCLGPCLDRAF
jgi:hypothetical protein